MITQPVVPTIQPEVPHDPRGLGGLLALVEGVERALPLVSVRVRAEIAGDACRTVVEQRFRNDHPDPIEAVHLFPLPEDGAVVEMELRAGETVVRAECRERVEAERAFAAARDAGHRAALLTAERADVHTLRVTNLPPGEEVSVRIVVVERLVAADGRLRWRFPTVIAPRYLPGAPIGHGGPGTLPDTDLVPDASRLQPPLRLEGGTTLDLEARIDGAVAALECSLHAVRVGFDGGVVVAPSGKATLDRDFVLAYSTGEAAVAARAYTDGAHTVVVVEPPIGVAPALPRDAVFVVDISGSMGGGKLEAAKNAIQAALHGLLPGDRFRLVAFDDRVEVYRPDFVALSDAALADADRWIANLRARGGTEMLPAIADALGGSTPEGRVRTVLFVTDGQAQNETELVAAVANRRQTGRFFTLGIDTAVNGALLGRLARVGGGTCELAAPSDDIDAVIARIEARFGSPVADDVRVDGDAARPDAGVLFAGRPWSAVLAGAPAKVTVSLRTPDGARSVEATPRRVGFALGPLWARERISWLEDRLTLKPWEEEALRPEIVRVALAHHIASRFTAFVAVETSRTVTGPRREVVQPVELPVGWDESFRQAPMGAPAGAPAVGGGRASGLARAAMSAPPAASAPYKAVPPPPPSPVLAEPAAESDDMVFFDRMGPADTAREAAPRRRAASAAPPSPKSAPAPAPAPSSAASGAAAPAKAKKAEAASAPPADVAGDLARTQSADGSFGGDVRRTAAALVLLVKLGHTRQAGVRRRTVLKAAAWLAGRSEPEARLALAVLERAERGEPFAADAALRSLSDAGPEGRALAVAL